MIADMVNEAPSGFLVEFIAHDGRSMLAKLKDHQPDLLVADIKMPVVGGLELLEETRALYPDLVCVMLTSYSEFEYARAALRLGAFDYILKTSLPESLHEVLQRVRETLTPDSGSLVATDARLDAGLRLKEHLDHAVRGPFDLVETAQRWGYNPHYLSRAFKEATGTTPKRYHTQAKVALIAKMLSGNPLLLLKEAAAMVHFDDELYLSKVFKLHTGLSYTEFRNKLTGE